MPGVDGGCPVEWPRRPGNHGQGEDGCCPAPVGEVEGREHRNEEHRDGEDGCPDEPRAELGAFGGATHVSRVLGGPDRGLVACCGDGGGDLFVCDGRRDGDVGGLKGQIDGGFDAVELSEFAFDPVDAGGARHALDIEVNDTASGLVQQLLVTHGALLFSSFGPFWAVRRPARALRLRWRPRGSLLQRPPRRSRQTTMLRWR